MGSFSIWHILIFAIIVLLLFGGNRFSSMMGDVAKGLKSFKQGMADDEDEKRKRYEEHRRTETRQLPREEEPIDVASRPVEPSAPPPRDDEAR
jgi:sec-independent protein translocase protein TatA